MTKLIVKRIDPEAPGSYAERREYRRITKRLNKATAAQDIVEQITALDDADDWVISRLRTDDGTPVSEILKTLSIEEFDHLWRSVGSEDESVPPATASS